MTRSPGEIRCTLPSILSKWSHVDKHNAQHTPRHFAPCEAHERVEKLWILLSHSQSWAEVVFTQAHSVSGSPGQTVTISCTHRSGSIDSSYVHWYQQLPGNAITTVIYEDKQRPSGVPVTCPQQKQPQGWPCSRQAENQILSRKEEHGGKDDKKLKQWRRREASLSLRWKTSTQGGQRSPSELFSECRVQTIFQLGQQRKLEEERAPKSPPSVAPGEEAAEAFAPRALCIPTSLQPLHIGWSSDFPHGLLLEIQKNLMTPPLQRVARKGGLGQPSPTAGAWAVSTMAWTPLLLLIISHCTGSLSQPVLTQPSFLSGSPGASARLTCTLRSDISVGSKGIYWYQQKSESAPRYLLYYDSDSNKHQGSGVPRRFSGSKDASANAGLLLISGLQSEDEADYYCMIWHSSASHSDTHRWGSGTKTSPFLALVL
ncbi:uncharacterized protein LOC101041970 [Saimiri boliviensis]|uniref:uncharacterized protein LOC101041970 n=1 Tax=Saimiri boliviensis TaxID=27679 RepID=UPI003D783801